MGVKRGKKNK